MRLLVFSISLLSFNVLAETLITDKTKGDFLLQQCEAFKEDGARYEFDFSHINVSSEAREESLYLFDNEYLPADWIVIDTTKSSVQLSNTLKLPVHTIKHKKYLAEQRILLLGNGKSYALLESNAHWLRKHMVEEVKILVGGKKSWLMKSGHQGELMTLNAAEFFAESSTGRWNFVNTQKELSSAISYLKSNNSLTRYLIVNPNLNVSSVNSKSVLTSLFKLDGGAESIENYAFQQGVILTAKKDREAKNICKDSHVL